MKTITSSPAKSRKELESYGSLSRRHTRQRLRQTIAFSVPNVRL
jgi:hypothetical protein